MSHEHDVINLTRREFPRPSYLILSTWPDANLPDLPTLNFSSSASSVFKSCARAPPSVCRRARRPCPRWARAPRPARTRRGPSSGRRRWRTGSSTCDFPSLLSLRAGDPLSVMEGKNTESYALYRLLILQFSRLLLVVDMKLWSCAHDGGGWESCQQSGVQKLMHKLLFTHAYVMRNNNWEICQQKVGLQVDE